MWMRTMGGDGELRMLRAHDAGRDQREGISRRSVDTDTMSSLFLEVQLRGGCQDEDGAESSWVLDY